MFCEQCGSQIADGDLFCQECGWKVTAEAATETVAAEAEATAENVATEAAATAEAVATEAKDAVAEVAEPVVATVTESPVSTTQENSFWTGTGAASSMAAMTTKTDAPKKKSGKKWIVVLAVLALIGILVAVNFSRIVNFFHKTFSSPEEYYQYIEAKQVDEMVDTYMNGYDTYLEMLSMESTNSSIDFTVELGDDLRDIIEMADVEVEWLESVNLGLDVNYKDEILKIAAMAGLNDVDILSGNVILDFAEEDMYMQIPELSEKYVGASFEDLDIEYDEEMFEIFDLIKKYMPESKDLEELLSKYITLVVEQLDDVEEETVKLEVGDVSQKCTALEVTIDTETAQKIAEAVLKEISEDKDLKKMFDHVMGMAEEVGYPADTDEIYDEFLEIVDYALENIEELDMGEEEIVMTVYVNGKGEVIGREIEVAGAKFRYAMPQEGSKFEMECYVEIPDLFGSVAYESGYDEEYEPEMLKVGIEGEGKKKGNKITGEFVVEYDSNALLNINVEGYDVKKAKNGEMVGTFTFTLPKSLKSMLSEQGGSEVAMLAGFLDYGIEIDMDTDSDGGTVSIAIVDDEEFLVKLTMEAESGKGEKVSVPSSKNVVDPMDEDEMEEWVEDFDWDGLIKKLDKAKVDEEYIEMLEDLVDEMY